MEVKYTTYIVDGPGHVKTVTDNFSSKIKSYREHCSTILEKYEVQKGYEFDNVLVGLYFSEGSAPKGWINKKNHPFDLYLPNKRTKQGKIDAAELSKKTKPSYLDLDRELGIDFICLGSKALFPQYISFADKFYLRMPLKPEGTHAELDTTGLKKIKEWELVKAREEWEAGNV